jgi:hypothetical protein
MQSGGLIPENLLVSGLPQLPTTQGDEARQFGE